MSSSKLQSRGLARRQAMLQAATELFLSQGYDNTSLSDILELSKGSRSTLYEQFGNKEGLLKAIIERSLEGVSHAIDGMEDIPELDEDGLVEVGVRFLRHIIEPQSLGVFRLMVGVGYRLPELSAYVNDRCQREIDCRLADIFRRRLPAVRENKVAAEELAVFFLWTVTGDIHFQHAIGSPMEQTEAEVEQLIRSRVRLFLHGIAGMQA